MDFFSSQEGQTSQITQTDIKDNMAENKVSSSEELKTQDITKDAKTEQGILAINAKIPSKDNLAEQENINATQTKRLKTNQSNAETGSQKDIYFKLPFPTTQNNELKINDNDIDDKNKKCPQTTDPKARSFAKVLADYIFLLGRLTTQAITDFNGNIIIPQNTLITAEVVLKAFNQGRLLELTKYSKA